MKTAAIYANSVKELPLAWACLRCGATKPRHRMIVNVRGGGRGLYARPRCKDCANASARAQRASRSEYQRRWRRRNVRLSRAYARDQYWRHRPEQVARVRVYHRRVAAALRVQQRLWRRGDHVAMAEARWLLRRYGAAYPLACGLTPAGRAAARHLRAKSGCSQVEAVQMAWEDSPANRLPRGQQVLLVEGRSRQGADAWRKRASLRWRKNAA